MHIIIIYLLGAIVRYFLISGYADNIKKRVEVSTPLNSWKQIVESVHLMDVGVYPYSSDALHESPLFLKIYQYMIKSFGEYVYLVFIISDLLTAYILMVCMHRYLSMYQNREEVNSSKIVATVYLLNPFSILNCVGLTRTVFTNLILASFLIGLVYGKVLVASLFLATCISQQFYMIMLFSPLILQLTHFGNKAKALIALCLTVLFWLTITYISYCVFGTWDFIRETYGFTFAVSDLRPNIGVYWYLLTEMFEHFHSLFTWSLQIHVTITYVLPITLCFRKDPVFIATILLTLVTIYKSYPCFGDVGFIIALYPCWKHLFQYMQSSFLVAASMIVTPVLGWIVWYLWIYSRTANANFYFGVMLVFIITEIVFVIDVTFAYIKREFLLCNEDRLNEGSVIDLQ